MPLMESSRFDDLLTQLREEHERLVSLALQQDHQSMPEEEDPDNTPYNAEALSPKASSAPEKHASGNFDVLELKHSWVTLKEQAGPVDLTISTGRWKMMSKGTTKMLSMSEGVDDVRKCNWIPFAPTNALRLYWDFLGVFLLAWDIVNIPLIVFEPPHSDFTVAMDRLILGFWTCDIFLSFCSGYYDRDILVMDMRKIAINYIRTWFVLDIIVVAPDWYINVADTEGNSEANSAQRLLRGARIMRVLRLLRVVKLQRVMNKVYDMIDNEYTFIFVELIKMLIVIVVVNHLLACGWFLMGKLASETSEPSWLTWSENFLEEGMGYQYATSLHWSLTQFTPASMDVVARNLYERAFSIVVLFFAMFAFSSIVGTITASITILRGMTNDRQKSFWLLRRYLKQKQISKDLTKRMTRFLEHRLTKQERLVQPSKVRLLVDISDQLASELAHEMYGRSLQGHEFFHYLSEEMDVVAFRICHTALKAQQLAYMDVLFSVGEEGLKTFVMNTSGMQYYHRDPTLVGKPALKQDEWVAEAVLWTWWRHRGECVACSPCEVLALECGKFIEIMSMQWRPWRFAQRYGRLFVKYLNGIDTAKRCDVIRREDWDFATACRQAARVEDDDDEDGLDSPSKQHRHSLGSTPKQLKNGQDEHPNFGMGREHDWELTGPEPGSSARI